MTPLENHGAELYIEVSDTRLNFRPLSISDEAPTGEQVLSLCDVSPRDEYVVLQWLPSGEIEEVRADETITLSGTDPARLIVEKADRLFRLVLDERSISWPKRKISSSTLRELGKINPKASLYIRRGETADERIADDAVLALDEIGVEYIYSKREIWKLNVQGVMIESHDPTIRVRDALIAANLDPDLGWIIVLKTSESKRQVTLDEIIDLRTPGIEKLRLTPREINNGEVDEMLRRDFKLLSSDEAGLDARSIDWETLVDAGRRWLILSRYPLPDGFNVSEVTIALEIPPAYPSAEIDMFYCMPHLACLNRNPIPQTEARVSIRGQNFQRWSRHRGPGAPWNPSKDTVLTHLALVDAAILREVEP